MFFCKKLLFAVYYINSKGICSDQTLLTIHSSEYSQSASLRSSTPNNCSAVYQEDLALFLIQASPHPLLIAFRNPAGDLLDLVKFSDQADKIFN